MGNYTAPWKKYATFSGRAGRGEFWTFVLINWVISAVLYQIGKSSGFNLLYGIWELAILVPSIAVTWRRLHDSGRSGGWWFLVFLPFIGWIWLFILVLLGGTPGPNQHGEPVA
jgi:uncharacterized membrane protein YhaH (DUF805 family)